jgi:hypothetical protein
MIVASIILPVPTWIPLTVRKGSQGRRFRILNVVNDVTKECLGAIPDTSILGKPVARELTTMIERRVREPVKTEIVHAAAAVTVTKRSKR